MQQISSRVCRLEINPPGELSFKATGFLVSSDLVLTNYHNVAPLLDSSNPQTRISIRFGYVGEADGIPLSMGQKYRLSSFMWLIDFSEPSPSDESSEDQTLPNLDQLDYALLCLDEMVGLETINYDHGEKSLRGWFRFPDDLRLPEIGDGLYIFQYGQSDPLMFSQDTNAIIEINENSTRIKYLANTYYGASGSPCFDDEWRLVALHHAGDSKYEDDYQPQFNQGIPIKTIAHCLQRKGLFDLLNKETPYLLNIISTKYPASFRYLKLLHQQCYQNSSSSWRRLQEWFYVLSKSQIKVSNDKKNTDFWFCLSIWKHYSLLGGKLMSENFFDTQFPMNVDYRPDEKDLIAYIKVYQPWFEEMLQGLNTYYDEWSNLDSGLIDNIVNSCTVFQKDLLHIFGFFFLYTDYKDNQIKIGTLQIECNIYFKELMQSFEYLIDNFPKMKLKSKLERIQDIEEEHRINYEKLISGLTLYLDWLTKFKNHLENLKYSTDKSIFD